MKKLSLFSITALLFLGCSKDESPELPPCLEDKLEILVAITCPNPSMTRYLTQKGHVYAFYFGDCPDVGSIVYDNQCNVLCSLGGFAVNSECIVDGVPLKLVGGKVIWP